jgi:hypothetical protein
MNKKLTAILSLLLLAGIAVWWLYHAPDDGSIPEVPLGVEHAVTITYSGSELIVQPYRFGVPVNLRIAKVIEKDGVRTYDIRYMLNTAGEFNISQYLATKDGSELTDLPEFKVLGLGHMSQNMDQRIQQVETMGIEIWHYYYECMAAAVTLWLVWLLLLIFYGREKPEIPEDTAPIETFYDVLSAYLAKIEDKTLDAKGKAQLEMLMINWWRTQLGYPDMEMRKVIRHIRKDAVSASAFDTVQQWLHNPQNSVSVDELLARLRPFSVNPQASGS